MANNKKEFKKNSSGYTDPTAYEAVKNIDAETERFERLLTAIFAMCDAAGFRLEERIVLKDKRTGKVWR